LQALPLLYLIDVCAQPLVDKRADDLAPGVAVAGDEVVYDLEVDAVKEDSDLGFFLCHFSASICSLAASILLLYCYLNVFDGISADG